MSARCLVRQLLSSVFDVTVRSAANVTQFYMTIYAAQSTFISPTVILTCGTMAFAFNMLESMLDLMWTTHIEKQNTSYPEQVNRRNGNTTI
jgi:hypothetical protein